MTIKTGSVPHKVCISTAARLAAKIKELAKDADTATVLVRTDDYRKVCNEAPHQTAGAFVQQVRVRLEKLLQGIAIESIVASPQQGRDFEIICTIRA